MNATKTLLLQDTALVPDRRLKDIALVLGASGALGLASQVAIPLPFTPVPITGQTLAVCVIGLLLGARRASAAVALYLLEGALGLPVFAGGASGPARLLGPTAGYLLAMPFAAWLLGAFSERGWDRTPARAALAVLAGSLVILVPGTAWLAVLFGDLARAAAFGFLPFVPVEIVKAAAFAVLFPGLWALRGARGPEHQ